MIENAQPTCVLFFCFVFRCFCPSCSMHLGCWRAYVVPVVSSAMAWHCIASSINSPFTLLCTRYQVVSLSYDSVVTTEVVSLLLRGSRVSGCVLTSFGRVGTVGMERGYSWSLVPFQPVFRCLCPFQLQKEKAGIAANSVRSVTF